MSEENAYVPVDQLTRFTIEALLKMGVPGADAEIITDVLLTADLWGIKSHGIAHLRMYNERIKKGLQLPLTDWTVVKESPTTAVIDGGCGMGMVVGYHAMQMAIEKAQVYGLGAVAVRNSSHYGAAGYYPMMAVKAGLAGMSFTNAHPSTAPTFGVKPMLGTNPIAVGVPTDEEFPYLYDAATSVAPRGKIEIAARASKPIPEGWVVNQNGDSETDSAGMIKRMNNAEVALLPVGGMGELFGGHKGYGLATMVEIFSAAFQNGTYLWGLNDVDEQGNYQFLRIGHFFLAINIENFIPLDEYRKITGDIMRELRNSPKVPGQPRIYTAGEKEYYNAKHVMENGVEIAPGVQKALKSLSEELKVSAEGLGF
ncbi:MAG TPA: lactate dehydrogenase [Chloroflexi bacterium]|nr:lactate dehydrogenase [Chloroflexota bacterium]